MDRVSSLPDELLGHILSFLTTKEAALTSVLSKRWRNLFAFVPNLVFLYPEESQGERHGILQSFMDFVDRVLALQGDSPINKFSLKCKNGVDSERVNQWICNVLQRGVSDLELFSDVEDGTYWRTSEVFRCMTLVELKLGNVVDLRLRNGDCFLPMLRTLVLDSVWFYSDQLQLLLSGCPALEELDMADLYWSDSDETVSSASLKTLAFQPNCRLDTLSFDTPHLVYLEYSDFAAKDYPLVNLKNLFEARIILNISDDQSERGRAQNNNLLEDDVILRLGNVWKLISGIRNVHKLYLSADTVEVLSLCCELLPVFNNLKSLCIKSAMDRGWQAMPVLLRNCPHLETLVLEGLLHYETARCGDACDCIYREDKGRSLMSCLLNKIQIKGFRGTVRELNMIENFLKSFPCLKEMEIYAEEDGPTDLEDPGIFELVVKIFILYDKIYSCDVQFLVRGSWFKTWTTAQ